MCGINGILAYGASAPAPSRWEVVATRDAMASRGPDGVGFWSSNDGGCLFGHRRLSIIDLSSRAAQPMASETGSHVICYNGEIYNFPELRTELEAQGARFRTSSDTEMLLHLYKRHGREMVQFLRGMYAFALWDDEKKGLLVARDPLGIKPLYFADDGHTYRFASQVKALLAGGAVPTDLEPAGTVGFHLFGWVPEPFSLFRAVRALPAGHTQWIDGRGAADPIRFHNVATEFAQAERREAGREALHELVRTAVRDSVRAHLLADVEVGLFLSSGIDSGAILGAARDLGCERIRAITIGFSEFEGTAEDEVPLASQLATRYDARHIVRRVDEKEFREDLPAILAAMDQPSIDGVNSWFVSKAAREQGLKVVLSGLGGDELLAGYPSFSDIPRWKRRLAPFARLPGGGRALQLMIERAMPGLLRKRPKLSGLLHHGGSWGGNYLLRRGLFLPHELPLTMDSDIAREGLARLDPVRRAEEALDPDPGSDIARVSVLETSFYMRNLLLRDADWTGMAHSLEIRVPLVDARLLAALAPYVHLFADRRGKLALAHVPDQALPGSIIDRPKTGFSVPTERWMAKAGTDGKDARRGVSLRQWAKCVYEATVDNAATPSRVSTEPFLEVAV
jgi:asparagine synthase (glutamine-hydrolysing)